MSLLLWLLGVIVIVVGIRLICPGQKGEPHRDYFAALNRMLREREAGQPVLLLDLDRVDHNIERVRAHLGDTSRVRVAVKSLPSPDLLRYILERLGSQQVMAFHWPFALQVFRAFPKVDILIGKPFPVSVVKAFLAQLKPDERLKLSRIQWLIDTPERLLEYHKLAEQEQLVFNINVEIDVGLHRGGVSSLAELDRLLLQIGQNPVQLKLSGLMGYDPHLVKAPAFPGRELMSYVRARRKSVAIYQRYVKHIQKKWPAQWSDELCFNGAGSYSYQLNSPNDWGACNDITIGSAFVKATDFDIPTLKDHKPAIFIATRILKKLERLDIPFLERVTPLWPWLRRSWQRAFFIYGGWWMAKPCSPQGLEVNPVYGRSTNQELLTAQDDLGLEVDDYIFLRPSQSEFVMLQFGEIRVLRGGQLIDRWPVFKQDINHADQALPEESPPV